ncbi:MAG: polysaccharide deacetylase family protein [Proteobacteria bacterium]|nr:polysaccharide deacetylase family protein [Pseudomonadota bacterium]
MAGRTPSDEPVFFDPSGRRARRLQLGAWIVATAAVLLLVGFTTSLAIAPQILPVTSQSGLRLVHAPAAIRHLRERRVTFDAPRPRSQPLPANARVIGAYFPPWQQGAIDSLRMHADGLTHVYPAWLQIGPDGRSLRSADWDPRTTPTTTPLMRISRAHHLRIVPTVSNAENSRFDPHCIELMLRTPGAGQAIIRQLTQFVDANELDGLQIDIEFLDQSMWPAYEAWLDELGRALHARGKELSVAVQASDDVATIRALAHLSDYVVAMAYDEHDTPNAPGPIASAGFVQSVLRKFSLAAPADKLVLGVGDYGYDWARDGSEPQTVTNAEAIAQAAGYRDQERAQDVIDFDGAALEPTYTYSDEHNVGHEVWFLDAVTVANAMRIASHYNTRGAALWALGMEDSSTWRVFGRNLPARPDLQVLTPPNEPEFIGEGELLTVRRPPSSGLRTYDINHRNGLIDEESYQTYPTSWLVARQGDSDGNVALTFDDGPDPRWTPAILDVLRRHHVNATFFMIGQSAVAYPDLVRRVMQDGNEIGNHSFLHPNMAHVGPERVRLELTATQRAIESIVGRSTRLFRPPFNADADPSSDGELMPVCRVSTPRTCGSHRSITPSSPHGVAFRRSSFGASRQQSYSVWRASR